MNSNNPFSDPHFMYLVPFMGLAMIVGVLVYVVPFWFIFKKAGFSPWLVLLFFVPLANLIVLYIVAFSPWKVVPVSQVAGSYPPAVYPPAGYPASYPPPGNTDLPR